MDWLNYHHLLYFWTVAREGSVRAASDRLHLAPATVSGQIKTLEGQLGIKLFRRAGRGIVLSDEGRVVYEYADEIFSIGRDLMNALRGKPAGRPLRLVVGVSDELPKLIAFRLVRPALDLGEPIRLSCVEGRSDRLVAELALHEIDLVLTDAPLSSNLPVKAFNHLLGECGVSFFAAPKLARSLRAKFPKSLDGAPFLLPAEHTSLRPALENWFEEQGVEPDRYAEFDDSALLKVFGQSGLGAFCAPAVIEEEVCRQYGVRVIGRSEDLRERFYAISVERRITNPAVLAIREAARDVTFARPGKAAKR